jgi:membrane dipeptidase
MTHIDPSEATIEHVVDHIEYAASLVSYNNVGIGTDFDGMEKSVVGLEDVTRFLDLVRLMLKRGISRENIERVIGLNAISVLQQVERVAQEKQGKVKVLEVEVEQLWNDEFRAHVRTVYPDRG